VGGNFENIGGLSAAGLGVLEGTQWQRLGGGTDGTILAMLAGTQQRVYAAGSFVDTLGGVPVGRIGLWDGTAWQPVGSGLTDQVLAQTTFRSEAILAGTFRHAGSTAANAIVRWDGANWSPLGNGLTNGSSPGEVRALAVDASTDTLIAGGGFTLAGGTTQASNIARWDGAAWQSLGSGTNAPVLALASYQDSIIAGGSFSTAGGVSAARIARFSPTGWQPLGAGFAGTGNVSVRALTTYNDELYAGGFFATSAGTPVAGIARWTGTTWQPVGTSPATSGVTGGGVLAMTTFDGELIIGGTFTDAGGASDTTALAKWNGSRWARVGPELSGGGPTQVNALATLDGKLFVGGSFASGGSMPLTNLAFFSQDTGWVAVGDGLGQGLGGFTALASPKSLQAFAGELIVGGDFTAQSSYNPVLQSTTPGTTVRAFFARWSPTGTPWSTARITSTPACNADLALTARLATGYGSTPATSYRWTRNGVPLEDSARIAGAATPNLLIRAATADDSGTYACLVQTACGTTSLARGVPVTIVCAAACDSIDFNNDGLFPDDTDLIEFLRVLAGGGCSDCSDLDFNNDGLFPDDSDLIDFLRVLAGGEC
jgi:hypothetical protein